MLSAPRRRSPLDDATPVVIDARRTPMCVKGGRLAHLDAATLASWPLRTLAESADGTTIDDVVLGNCLGPGGNLARVAALAADLGTATPGLTVDRQCGSGLAAILVGAQAVSSGAGLVLAGGVESASTAPERRIDGIPYTRAPFAPAGFPDPDMPEAAQALAIRDGISRSAQDAYAVRSHELALAAQAAGCFDAELVCPPATAELDDGPRRGAERLIARMVPLDSSVSADRALTGGNSSRNTDGAAAVAIVPNGHRRRGTSGVRSGLALRASAVTGGDPALPGIGPITAIELALERAGVELDDVAAIELVEAFAAQALAVLRPLGLADGVPGAQGPDRIDPRVCADGGALALGHPWGASGAVSVVRLFSRLVRAGAPAGTLGLSAAAIGGGMGIAAVWEVVR